MVKLQEITNFFISQLVLHLMLTSKYNWGLGGENPFKIAPNQLKMLIQGHGGGQNLPAT